MSSLADARRQAAGLAQTGHRPWPLPPGSWLQGQTWEHLLFLHWPVEPAAVRPHLPAELELHTYEGRAWVGVTPFRLEGLRLRGAPPLPWLSRFLEVNARTYVTFGDKPGIWFFALDTNSRMTVAAARALYGLPYHLASIGFRARDGWFEFASRRGAAEAAARYRSTRAPSRPEHGSLEAFLVERYCLYSRKGNTLLRAEIHHPPWSIAPAEVTGVKAESVPVRLAGPPLAHLGARQDVVIWPPAPV